jgi:RecJ-like exonuclease
MGSCPKCQGSGKVEMTTQSCSVCGGSGRRYSSACRMCYGTGRFLNAAERKGLLDLFSKIYDCPVCEGSGYFGGDYNQRVEDLAKNR